jgi:uncharacterized protein (TIGR01777 family)
MNIKKIVIAGGTGFIGKYLTERFINSGYKVIIISRHKEHVSWQDEKAVIEAIENSELLINLAGKSVNCRYTQKNKDEILNSRINTTKTLGQAVLQCKNPPELWINSGTATIYRNSEDKPMTETNDEIGSGFSVNVAESWEKAFFDFKLPETRQIVLRIAIVLGKNGGAVKPFINLVRFRLGGKQGSGKQMFSWIHIEDLFNIINYIQSDKNLNGIYNCSSPNPVENKTLMKIFREIMNIRIGLPAPKFLLKLGAFFIRTETELILKSRWVVPERLLDAGYNFKYPTIESALRNIINE